MSYYNNEEEFLSIYTACKLINGEKPVISKEELNTARSEFIKSVYSLDSRKKELERLNFDNLQKINQAFQQKASINRSWLKPCFIYKDEKLYPTYDFFDFTQTSFGEFRSFLISDRYEYFPGEQVHIRPEVLDKKYYAVAKKVAVYL